MTAASTPPSDAAGAFIDRFDRIDVAARSSATPLAGLTVAVKDLYDVAGRVTGFGSPDWAAGAAPARGDAPAVAALLAAGARLVGKTHMDEMAYSLTGSNAHYGAPRNAADPRRLCGGSSSGSAAAVAGELADIGLGSDTGGSVRLPAAFCGLYGLRVSHGRVSLAGARPLAPSFDAVGWFARRGAVLALTGAAYGIDPATTSASPAPRLVKPVDLWEAADGTAVDAVLPRLAALEERYGPARSIRLSQGNIDDWRETFRILQAGEIWAEHGAWVRAAAPNFGPGVRARFEAAARITAEEIAQAQTARAACRARFRAAFEPGELLAAPTVPGPAPFREAAEATLDGFRARALAMLAPAGLCGAPQLNLPAGSVDGGPVGLSLIGAPGDDALLLSVAAEDTFF